MKSKNHFIVTSLLLIFLIGFSITQDFSLVNSTNMEASLENENIIEQANLGTTILDKQVSKIVEEEPTIMDIPQTNLLEAKRPTQIYSCNYYQSTSGNAISTQTILFDSSERIKRTVDDTPNIIQIYYERLADSTITTYGLAGETIVVHVIVKGLISMGDRLNLEVRRDIISLPDTTLYTSYYDFYSDLLGSESIHIAWMFTLDPNQGDFGLGFGDIRSYFLKLNLDSGPVLWDGSGLDEYKLWMCGYLMLYGVQYYNLTTEGLWIPISYAIVGWDVLVTFYVAVVNGPIWGFDIQGVIKANVVWGIDETWYSDDTKTISSVIEPGIYYYNWSDTDGIPYYFTVPVDSYGNSPGDIRGLFGIIYMDAAEIDPLDPDCKRDELTIISNTIPQPPVVIIELPLDGYVTYNDTLSLAVDLSDPNSNYEIVSVEILVEGTWLDATSFYHATTGRLDVYVTNAFTSNGIKNVTVKAEDMNGLIGFDSVIFQFFSYGYFFPSTYIVENRKESLNIFNKEFRYDHYFNWGDEDNNVTIIPYFSITVDASVEYELLLAYPSASTAGDDFTAYLKVANPEIVLTIIIDLGFDYEFRSGDNFYNGSSSLYNKEISKGLALSFGIFRIDLRDISPLIAAITHLEIETQDFTPGFIDWLANFKLEVDFIPILKIQNLLAFDISGINCVPMFATLSITTDSLYAIPCTVSSTTTGEDDVTITLDNFRVEAAAGFEAYCQVTFCGKLLGIPIGPIDVNQWLYEHFGIKIPYLDLWLIGVTIPISGSVSVIIPLNPVELSLEVIYMFYSLDNITYTFELKDANGNLVLGATVQVDDYSQTYYATDKGGGIYEVVMDYYDLLEIIDVTVTKTGYVTLATSFSLFVDPPAVTKGIIWEFTVISLGILALVATTLTYFFIRLKKR